MPADFGAPVATSVDTSPDKGLRTLSDLMGLQQKKQQIQSGALTIQRQQAELPGVQAETQGKVQAMQTRMAAQKMAQTGINDQGNSIRLPNGEIDPVGLVMALGRIDPVNGSPIAKAVIDTHTARIGMQAAWTSLDAEQRKLVQGPLQALQTNHSDEMLNATRSTLDQLAQQHQEMGPLVKYAGTLLDHVQNTKDPKLRANLANAFSSQFQAGNTVKTQPESAQVYTGQTIEQGVTAPPAAGGAFTSGSSTPVTVTPGSQESIESDALGNKRVVRRDRVGNIISTRPVPGSTVGGTGGTPGAPGSGFATFTPGQKEDIANAQQEVAAIRSAGDQVPQVRSINSRILQLSKDVSTGPGTETWKKYLGGASALWGGFNNVNNYQELGKFLEKNAIQNMSAMGGPPSDARLAAAAAANGSTQFNAGALQAVTKFNDATTSAIDKYRRGVDKAVGLKNSDYTALPDFKAAWARNMDVDVFRVENAIRDGDRAELAKISKELGPARMKELAQKRRNLEALSATGRLP